MSAAADPLLATASDAASGPIRTTLLELVETIASVTSNDREVVATVVHLLSAGRVTLVGNFRGEPCERFRD